jgi:hypothetical protein
MLILKLNNSYRKDKELTATISYRCCYAGCRKHLIVSSDLIQDGSTKALYCSEKCMELGKKDNEERNGHVFRKTQELTLKNPFLVRTMTWQELLLYAREEVLAERHKTEKEKNGS